MADEYDAAVALWDACRVVVVRAGLLVYLGYRMGCRSWAPAGRIVNSVAHFTGFAWVAVVAWAVVCPVVAVAQSPDSHTGSTIELLNLESQFRAIAERVAPSVVAISAAIDPADADSDDALRADSLNTDRLQRMLDRATRMVGTGFVIDRDGYILTNEHVIADCTQLWITTDDRRVYPAVVVGSDPRADLAVLKVPGGDLPPVRFAPFGSVRRGMWTIALGNPYGMAATGQMAMSVGIVSATGRSLPRLASAENRFYSDLIQTTAEINPGNSGGPLFNLAGEVIGVSTAVILPQKSTNGIGFALPITPELLERVQELKEGREIVYAYLGVMVSTATARQRREAGITDGSGVVIDMVEKDSPAAEALQVGDIVTKVQDVVVSDSDQFVRVIGRASIEKPTTLAIRRGGKPASVQVQLRRRQLPSVAINRHNQRFRWRGMLLGPIPPNWASGGKSGSPEHGLLVLGIDPASPLVKQGVRAGAVLLSVAGRRISGVAELQSIINEIPAEQCKLEIVPPPDGAAPADPAPQLQRQAVVSGQ
ncbi:trypsin-like peptidase domain-containing protein [Fontivita pretiosa]|uniref:trypsin-like peptidase domain-containing protein n=1 Tax=Fontivita pretiosa TaxID=2989684 RepID=UPI003D1848A1